MDSAAHRATMARLEPLVGAWTTETSLPAATGHEPGLTVFEWTLDHHFLLERSTVPCTPDSLAIIGPDPGRGAYLQHYFDARGVVRTYAMNLVDGVLTLERHAPDFSPLAFQQRFSGRFSNDGASIRGAWETSADGSMWAHDFDLTFARAESSEGDAGLASA